MGLSMERGAALVAGLNSTRRPAWCLSLTLELNGRNRMTPTAPWAWKKRNATLVCLWCGNTASVTMQYWVDQRTCSARCGQSLRGLLLAGVPRRPARRLRWSTNVGAMGVKTTSVRGLSRSK